MKNTKHILLAAAAGALAFFFSSCEMNPKVDSQQDILPKSFTVKVPSSISNMNSVSGGRIGARTSGDTLSGNDIYQNLNTFIAVGAASSIIVDEFIEGIRQYHIDKILSLSYVSDDDRRTKNLVVISDVSFEGKDWDYELTVSDDASQGLADGGKALQIFWNKNTPVKGIAIFKPYNCDRIKNASSPNAVFRIDYTEAGGHGYDAEMEVRIAGLTLGDPVTESFSISSLHMFVGKSGDNVDVFGNSNHPNAVLFSNTAPGFDWAFVASGSDSKNIGVAEVGLPPYQLESSDRNVLLKTYSIKSVFTAGVNATFPGIDQVLVANYLKNTSAPGYFNDPRGFIAAGVSPGADYDVLTDRISALTPYSPDQTAKMVLDFK